MKALLQEEIKRDTFLPPTSKNIDNYLSWDDWKVLGLLSQGKGGKDGYALKNMPQGEAERKEFRMPAIVPIVLYNGKATCNTSAELQRNRTAIQQGNIKPTFYGKLIIFFKLRCP
jgi:hypothetical protein